MSNRYVSLDEKDRIVMSTFKEEWANEDSFEFTFPDDFDFSKQNDYLIQNGELVYSPPEPDPSVRIAELQKKLADTDYIPIKIIESQVTGVPLDDERAERYGEIVEQREQWREEIRQLEGEGSVESEESNQIDG